MDKSFPAAVALGAAAGALAGRLSLNGVDKKRSS